MISTPTPPITFRTPDRALAGWLLTLVLLVVGTGPGAGPVAADEAWPDAARDGQTAFHEGDYPAAIEAYETALGDGTRRAEVAYNLGIARYRAAIPFDSLLTPPGGSVMGMPGGAPGMAPPGMTPPGGGAPLDSAAVRAALADFQRAAAAGGGEVRSRAFHNAGNAELALGNLPGARELYRETLRLDPTDDRARYNLELVERLLAEQESQDQQQDQQPQDQQQEPQENQDQESDPEQQDRPQDSPPDSTEGQPQPPEESDQEQEPQDGQDQGDQEDPGQDQEGEAETPEESDTPQDESGQPQVGSISPEEARRELERLEEAERENLKALLRERRGRANVEKDW